MVSLCPGANSIAEAATLSSLSTYPEPTTGPFTIALPGSTFDLTLLDLSGRTVLLRTAINGQAQLDISSLPAGAYALRVFTRDGQLLRSRLVKY